MGSAPKNIRDRSRRVSPQPFSAVECACLAAGLVGFWVASPGHAETESRDTPPFHAVSVFGSWNVDITAGKDAALWYTESGTDRIGRMLTDGTSGGEYHTLSSNT